MSGHEGKGSPPSPATISSEGPAAISEAVAQLREAAAAKKCWPCGCLHSSLKSIDRAFPEGARPPELDGAMREARGRLTDMRYECLGCQVCYPALAINALNTIGDDNLMSLESCPTEDVEERAGWPPLPGDYTVLRFLAPVAVCTLTDENLVEAVSREAGTEVALVGTLQTENLGIERLITNLVANPNIRFLVVCGPDSRQTIGHLPGQSLVALAHSGLDERARIVEAEGKRPYLKNVSRAMVEHFRRTIEVFDLVGNTELPSILKAVEDCATRCPGPAEPFEGTRTIETIQGYLPEHMASDPAGYFVVFIDRVRGLLMLEHYRNDGVLDHLIEGRTAAELYFPAIDQKMVSRLDHAAYLGRELARAEHALRTGEPYVQDAAPERLKRSAEAQVCDPSYACE